MSMQHHFVVLWDSKSEKWRVDYDTADSVFSDGTLFDTDECEWFVVSEDHEDNDIKASRELERLISNANAQIT